MEVNEYLRRLAELKGSDLFLSVGAPATIKREGAFVKLGDEPMAKGSVKTMAYALMSEKQISEFERDFKQAVSKLSGDFE